MNGWDANASRKGADPVRERLQQRAKMQCIALWRAYPGILRESQKRAKSICEGNAVVGTTSKP